MKLKVLPKITWTNQTNISVHWPIDYHCSKNFYSRHSNVVAVDYCLDDMIDQIWKLRSREIPYKEDWILFLGSKLKLVKEYCPSVQMVREMVSVKLNWLKCNLNKNRKNSQRSSSAYCNLIKSKDDIDRLLLTIKIDQDMTPNFLTFGRNIFVLTELYSWKKKTVLFQNHCSRSSIRTTFEHLLWTIAQHLIPTQEIVYCFVY